jgi:hypothetical protein
VECCGYENFFFFKRSSDTFFPQVMSFESPGAHSRSSSQGSGSVLVSSLSHERAGRSATSAEALRRRSSSRQRSTNPAAVAHRYRHSREAVVGSGENLSLSTITYPDRGDGGSDDGPHEQTFFSNADEMLWSRNNQAVARREEKERMWRIHVENVRRFREPELRSRLESIQMHRAFNKKMREEKLRGCHPHSARAAAPPITSRRRGDNGLPDAADGVDGVSTRDQLSHANVHQYFYSLDGIVVLPEGHNAFDHLQPPYGSSPAVKNAGGGGRAAQDGPSTARPSGQTINKPGAGKKAAAAENEISLREDAWFASAQQRMREEASARSL